ncbi:MAG: hypothetical protein GYA55_06710 [SAR324 cluster bacterium]|uniref:MFS transporter n=1 Tax=SAR324 cluster bacterium TaxID=2024889 RepID=A0A7X9IJP0_9DELT|nr:hypothetical protein [SAR324 cluster bacterium]
MKFLYLILAAFFAGLGLGYVKFFALSYLSAVIYEPSDKIWIIQSVGALITLGPFLAYLIAGPIAASFRKAKVMRYSAIAVAIVLTGGLLTDWFGTAWFYVFMTGLIMGIYNPAKGASIPLESARSGRSTELITATLAIVYIAGILAGAPFATEFFARNPYLGAASSVFIFVPAAFFGGLCTYPNEDNHLFSFSKSFWGLLEETKWLFKHYWIYIVAPSMIWGMASAASLAVTAYAEEKMLGSATKCSLMAAFATIGVIVGNAVSVKLRSIRYLAASICSIGIVLVLVSIPILVELSHPSMIVEENTRIYILLALDLGLMGFFFGITTNLIEAEYYSLTYTAKKEGTGSALLSAMTAFFPFTLGGGMALAVILKLASPITQFIWLAVITMLPTFMIIILALRKPRSGYV